jgi:hypothetical protein
LDGEEATIVLIAFGLGSGLRGRYGASVLTGRHGASSFMYKERRRVINGFVMMASLSVVYQSGIGSIDGKRNSTAEGTTVEQKRRESPTGN